MGSKMRRGFGRVANVEVHDQMHNTMRMKCAQCDKDVSKLQTWATRAMKNSKTPPRKQNLAGDPMQH